MRSGLSRYALVFGLLLLTGLTAAELRAQRPASSSVPPASRLISGTGWVISDTYVPAAFTYRQWLLSDASGHQALLYVAVTSRSVVALAWTGELGYQGAGYEVARTGERAIVLSDGSTTTVNDALVQRLSDKRFLLYAVASPHGVLTHRIQSWPDAMLSAIGGDPGPYFMVRVSTPIEGSETSSGQIASGLMRALLPRLVVDAQSP